MKKALRILALLIAAALVCLTLCSCEALDNIKRNRAVYVDSTKESVTFRGKTYRKIDFDDTKLEMLSHGRYYENSDETYVADSDVPVLLTSQFGDEMYCSMAEDDKVPVALMAYQSVHDLFADEDKYKNITTELVYYVREDLYDSVKTISENAVINSYYTYLSYFDRSNEWVSKYRYALLEKDTTEAINNAIKSKKRTSWLDVDESRAWNLIEINPCDEHMLFTDNSGALQILSDSYDFYVFFDNDYRALYKISRDDYNAMKKLYDLAESELLTADVRMYQDWERGDVIVD